MGATLGTQLFTKHEIFDIIQLPNDKFGFNKNAALTI
jgi:hypothetical protein